MYTCCIVHLSKVWEPCQACQFQHNMVIHRLGSVNIPSVNQVFNTNPKTTRFEHDKTLDDGQP